MDERRGWGIDIFAEVKQLFKLSKFTSSGS